MEAEWKEEREHHLQKNNTMDVRERQRDGLKKHQIWPFWTSGRGITQGCWLQTETQLDRQTDPDLSVNLRSTSWSMIPQWYVVTPQMCPGVVTWTIQTLHPTLRMSQRGRHMMNGGPRACSWQLFVTVVLAVFANVPSVKRFQNVSPVHAAVLRVPASSPTPHWTSCTVILAHSRTAACIFKISSS